MTEILCPGVKGESVTLAEAATVLNEHKHRGHSRWHVYGNTPRGTYLVGEDRFDCLEPFEALAIAEKYLRESNAGSPRPFAPS